MKGPRTVAKAATCFLALALVASACGGGGDAPTPSPSPTAAPTTPPPTSASPSPSASPSVAASCAERTLDGMTEAQRVGQLFMIGLADSQLGSAERSAIQTHHFGSVTFIQTSTVGVQATRAVTDAVQQQATSQATAGVGFLVGVNQEGGKIQALRGPGFSTMPTAVEQGTWSVGTLRAQAKRWGAELAAAGVNLNFAPVMDVVPAGTESVNQPIGVLQREFGSTATVVSSHGVAFLKGMLAADVDPTAKHFPGLGRVEGNTDFTADVVDDVTTPNDPLLAPFQAAVDAGVPFVMVAEATYTQIDPDHLAVFSPTVIEAMLQGELGFTGVVISDEIGDAEAVQSIPAAQRGVDFLNAGGDLIVSKTIPPAVTMANAVLARAKSHTSFAERVDNAAMRVLDAKDALGLLPCSS